MKEIVLFGFELGNGWILSIIFLVVSYGPLLFAGEAAKRAVDVSFLSKRGRVIIRSMWPVFLLLMVYPLFLRIQFGSVAFYAGAALMGTGTVALIVSCMNFTSTPADQAVNQGIYRISRNPIYISTTAMLAGLALMLHSRILGISVVVYVLLQHLLILEEEKFCEKQYGASYIAFKKRVPRYLFF